MNKEEELILVTPKSTLEKVGYFQGFTKTVEPYLQEILDKSNNHFVKRGPAEKNPDLKQIIPYCIIMQGNKILVYQRGQAGGENRLKNLWSCGIGGHINPIDRQKEHFSREDLKTALLRELKEELILPKGEVTFETMGLINDDSNPVGEVHLGLVEIAQIPQGEILPNEEAITNLRLLNKIELNSQLDNLENWSQIVVKNLGEIMDKTLKEFHIDLGNEEGLLGIGAVVKAKTREQAMEQLREFLPEEISLNDIFDRKELEEKKIEYINLYLRKDNLSKQETEYR
jgi:predicted NUDIX family phosphoesterase